MSAPGRLLAAGREADIYEVGEGWVLRRYRDHDGAEVEAATIEHVRRHGFPVPAVREAGGRDIVMEWIEGPSMLDALIRRPWTFRRHARLLADLHDRLHAVPPLDGLRVPFGEGPAVLHMDLHPANVLLSPHGPVVIDWAAACRGVPEADVAQAWVILATSVIPERGWKRAAGASLRGAFLRQFLSRYDRASLRRILPEVAAARLRDPHVLEAERSNILRLVEQEGSR